MPKGAGPVRPVEGGKWRPATRRADAGRLRGGARPGNKQCRVRRSIQPTYSERALLIAGALARQRGGGALVMPPSYTRGPYDPLDRRPSYSGSCHRLKFEGLKG